MKARLAGLTVTALFAATPALAHHPLGGTTPETFWHGFLSGLGHPVIGVDHFAFIVLVGLAAAFLAARKVTPLFFIAATVAGCLLAFGGIILPAAEIIIAASVVLAGAMVVSGRKFGAAPYAALFALAGLFHGWAYGGAIVGAETTPLAAYLIGFSLIEYGIALGVMWITRSLWQAASPQALNPRLAGAVAAGLGAAFLIENIEGLIFA